MRGRVIPLAFHVDYWNHLGWRDPYSSAEWSQRQASYERALKLDSVYTPQAVVDGTRQMIGSDRRSIYDAVSRASHEAAVAQVRIDGDDARGSTPLDLDLFAAEVSSAPATVVRGGENSGRTLVNDAIVRKLTRVARVHGEFAQHVGGANVVFLQDPKTLKIYAAAARGVSARRSL